MEFNNNKLEELIAKYEDATATLDEEQYLQKYFTTQDVAPHLEHYKYLFTYFKAAKTETLSLKLPLPLPKKKVNYKWLSIAVVLVLAVGFYAQYNFTNTQKQDKEVLLAYQQTRMALELLSNNLNTGTEKVKYLSSFEQTTNQIFKINNQ